MTDRHGENRERSEDGEFSSEPANVLGQRRQLRRRLVHVVSAAADVVAMTLSLTGHEDLGMAVNQANISLRLASKVVELFQAE